MPVPKINPWLIGIAIVLVIIGGLGWKAKLYQRLFENKVVENTKNEQESGLKTDLLREMDEYVEYREEVYTDRDRAAREVVEAGRPLDGDPPGTLARMRRSDAAWRRGVERLCPECAPDGVGDPGL